MSIEISKEARLQAVASIERYCRENLDEPIGNVAAGAMLGFFLEEIGPLVYNRRMQARILELDIEVHEDEFTYWRKYDRPKKGR